MKKNWLKRFISFFFRTFSRPIRLVIYDACLAGTSDSIVGVAVLLFDRFLITEDGTHRLYREEDGYSSSIFYMIFFVDFESQLGSAVKDFPLFEKFGKKEKKEVK